MIFSNNPYQGSAYFTSSSAVSASLSNASNYLREFVDLKQVNSDLAAENAKLRLLLEKKIIMADPSYTKRIDSIYTKKYSFITAKVVNNSVDKFHNYLTINKGFADSIAPGMGVICPTGVVGKVKSCSKNFATITSLLHKDMMISAKLKSSNAIGSIRWEGYSSSTAKLLYIPRHLKIKKGDLITASEFNSVFPEGEVIGRVASITAKGDENFYTINVKLATNFNALSYVYVVKNKLKFEQDSLEMLNKTSNDSK